MCVCVCSRFCCYFHFQRKKLRNWGPDRLNDLPKGSRSPLSLVQMHSIQGGWLRMQGKGPTSAVGVRRDPGITWTGKTKQSGCCWGLHELQRDSTCSLAPAGVPCLRGDRVYLCCSPRLCQDPARLLPLNTSLHSVLSHAKRWVPPLPHITEWGTAVRGLAQGPQLYCQPIVPSTGAGGLDDPSTQKASHPLGLHLHWTHLSDLTCSFQVLGVIARPLPSVAERLLQSL